MPAPLNPALRFPYVSGYDYDKTSLSLTPIAIVAGAGPVGLPVPVAGSPVDATSMIGIESVRYGNRKEGVEKLFGVLGLPYAKTPGRVMAHATLTLTVAQGDWLRAQLAAAGGFIALAGYMDALWALTVTRSISGFLPVTDILIGCSLANDELNWSDSGGRNEMDIDPLIALISGFPATLRVSPAINTIAGIVTALGFNPAQYLIPQ